MTSAAWPQNFIDATTQLTAQYQSMLTRLAALPDRSDTPGVAPRYMAVWTTANSSQGPWLIGGAQPSLQATDRSIAQSQAVLDYLIGIGYRTISLTIGWPNLDPQGLDPNLALWQHFYTTLANYAHAKNVELIISVGTGGTPVDHSHYTVDEVFAGLRSMSAWVIANLKPSIIIGQCEVTADKMFLRDCKDMGGSFQKIDAYITPAYWVNHIKLMCAADPPGTLRAGGASNNDPQAYWDACCAVAELPMLDGHPFAFINQGPKQLGDVLLDRYEQAIAAGKRLICTQSSLFPQTKQETGSLPYMAVYVREMWSGFAPLMLQFQEVQHQITRKMGLYAHQYFFHFHTHFNTQPDYDPRVTSFQQFEQKNVVSMVNKTCVVNPVGQQWLDFGKEPPVTPAPPQVLNLTVTPTSVQRGQTATVAWQTSDATMIELFDGTAYTDVSQQTSIMVQPTTTTPYSIRVTNVTDQITSNPVTLTVTDPPPPPPPPVASVAKIIDFQADKHAITAGDIVTLTWTTQDATKVTIRKDQGTAYPQHLAGNLRVSPDKSADFTVQATHQNGQVVQQTLHISVAPQATPKGH